MDLYGTLVEYVLIMTKHFYTQKKIKFAIKSKKRKKILNVCNFRKKINR
jgi:hypothetical protein